MVVAPSVRGHWGRHLILFTNPVSSKGTFMSPSWQVFSVSKSAGGRYLEEVCSANDSEHSTWETGRIELHTTKPLTLSQGEPPVFSSSSLGSYYWNSVVPTPTGSWCGIKAMQRWSRPSSIVRPGALYCTTFSHQALNPLTCSLVLSPYIP